MATAQIQLLVLDFFLLSLFATTSSAQVYTRVCESRGVCFNCGDFRYSYYKCTGNDDCSLKEFCNVDGFCCPQLLAQVPPLPLMDIVNSSSRCNSSNSSYILLERSISCPDGSNWMRKCASDKDCHPIDEICAEGKCCAACRQRRRQVLDELPTTNVFGVYLPQCTENGRYYRPKQCRIGVDQCWCVSEYGRTLLTITNNTDNYDKLCTVVTQMYSKDESESSLHTVGCSSDIKTVTDSKSSNSSSRCSAKATVTVNVTRVDANIASTFTADADNDNTFKLRTVSEDTHSMHNNKSGSTKCGISSSKKGCPGNENDSNKTEKHYSRCGENEDYVRCFNPCQATCNTLDQKPCPLDECIGGCHCKPGYVRIGSNPKAICVHISQCSNYSSINQECNDPLKVYSPCGSACPISCATRNAPLDRCSEVCTAGCFCRIPYILEDVNDPINSRCVLPAQCQFNMIRNFKQSADGTVEPYSAQPTNSSTVVLPQLQSGFRFPVSINYYTPPTYTSLSTSNYRGYSCVDPLKNFLSCGSACPAACNNRNPLRCEGQCISGCFCRAPYILTDSSNLNSRCVLPQKCPATTPVQRSCSDPRKQWVSCYSAYCTPSCNNLKGNCKTLSCKPGCACREPYVLKDANDPNSRCILASECFSTSQCGDMLKEYRECASSCPMGCNNLNPKTCTPCVSGCFCKMGYIFEDAEHWRTSKCVQINQCKTLKKTAATNTPYPSSSIPAFVNNECPVSTSDNSGKKCVNNEDCPSPQKCCPPSSFINGAEKGHKCACSDPHAVWNSCGSLCPEYCGQPSIPVCSPACSPGCHCAPGYIRARNDVMAPCILRSQCSSTALNDNSPVSTTAPINPFEDERDIAVVNFIKGSKNITGKLHIARLKGGKLKLWGILYALPVGKHAVVLHQYGDVSNFCANIGPPLKLTTLPKYSGSIGNIDVLNTNVTEILQTLEWSDPRIVVGRSVAIHQSPIEQLNLSNSTVLTCGTVGIVS